MFPIYTTLKLFLVEVIWIFDNMTSSNVLYLSVCLSTSLLYLSSILTNNNQSNSFSFNKLHFTWNFKASLLCKRGCIEHLLIVMQIKQMQKKISTFFLSVNKPWWSLLPETWGNTFGSRKIKSVCSTVWHGAVMSLLWSQIYLGTVLYFSTLWVSIAIWFRLHTLL